LGVVEQAVGLGSRWSARSAARTNDLDAGVTAATSCPAALVGWGAVKGLAMRRVGAGGLAARLMCARWCHRRALRSWLPHPDRGRAVIGGHVDSGGRCCCGGRPAHGEHLAHAQPGEWSETVGGVISSGGHLGPDEPGELAGDGGSDDLAVGLAGVQPAELAAQAQLRRPGPGNDVGFEALLAAAVACTDGGFGLVGPSGLDELAAQMGVAGMGDATAAGAVPAGSRCARNRWRLTPARLVDRAEQRVLAAEVGGTARPSRPRPARRCPRSRWPRCTAR
jgi:hypothetical protein